MTLGMGPIDGRWLHHQNDARINWSTISYNDVDIGASSLKRPGDPTSPPLRVVQRKMTVEDKNRKRSYRRGMEGRETPPRGLTIERAQGQLYDDG